MLLLNSMKDGEIIKFLKTYFVEMKISNFYRIKTSKGIFNLIIIFKKKLFILRSSINVMLSLQIKGNL